MIARVRRYILNYIGQFFIFFNIGVVLRCSRDIQERVHAQEGVSCESSDSDVEYPLTPPLSDHSESHSTDLNILDRDLGTVTLHVNGAPAKRKHSRIGVLKRRRAERTHALSLFDAY